MTKEEKDLKKTSIIMEFTGIEANKMVRNMTVLELYDLIKLAVNRKQEDL
jgi:3'-phosphoadenosine 5'-phosphosulfate sulfotransferase